MRLVVDRFHFRNHHAPYCTENVNPADAEAEALLRRDDKTSAAEGSFSWLARSKHVFRTMNEASFLFTVLRLMHLRNCYTAGVPLHGGTK